jgi:hypothetical protein
MWQPSLELPGQELDFGSFRLTVEGKFDPEAVVREGTRHDIVVQE